MFFMGESIMYTLNKVKCRYCGSDELYLQQCIVTRSSTDHDKEGNLIYEEPECFHDDDLPHFVGPLVMKAFPFYPLHD